MGLLKSNKSSYAIIGIKALEYTLFSVMMAITIAGIVRTESEAVVNFNKLWLISIVLYFISAFINHKFERMNTFLLVSGSMILIVGSMFLVLGNTFYFFEIPLFVSLVLIWTKGINLDIHSEKIEPLRKRIIFGLIFLILSYFVVFKAKLAGEYGLISHYYIPFYGILGFMMLNIVNMHSAYASGHFKINENKNVDRFGKIALTISLVVLLIMQLSIFDIGHVIKDAVSVVFDIVFKIISVLLFPILWLIGLLLDRIKSKFVGEELEKGAGLFNQSKMDLPKQEGAMITPGMETAFTVLTWAVLIFIGALIIWKVYQQVSIKKKVKSSDGNEEREFVFNLKDAYHELFNRNHKLNSYDKVPKHPIRKAYREALIDLRKKGIEKPDFFTPKEYYNDLIKKSQVISTEEKEKLNELTEAYQKIRFGSDHK